mgnify:CR=1 FL=1
MKTIVHEHAGTKIIELVADSIIVTTPQDALDLLMSASYEHGATKIILHQRNITPDFFDLKTRIAGEILQKVVNYRMQLALVGDFGNVESDSLRAFILESNRGKHVFFCDSVDAAVKALRR